MIDPAEKTVFIPVPAELLDYVPQALARLRYLHEDLRISVGEAGFEIVSASGEVPAHIRREIQYHLYREKIFQDTLPLRRDLYKMLSS